MIRRIIILCTGNICRSPMAAAVLESALADGRETSAAGHDGVVAVSSAGLGALVGYPADDCAIRLLHARGLDISTHRARAFDGALGLAHDLILTMTLEQRYHVERRWPLLQGRVFVLGCWNDVEIEDPYRRGDKAFRKALSDIDRCVAPWLPRILAQ
jgi:protein-tyrosine phosphatase